MENKLDKLVNEYLKKFPGKGIPIDRSFSDKQLEKEIEKAIKTGKPIKYGSELGVNW